jgi:hypothetical protein
LQNKKLLSCLKRTPNERANAKDLIEFIGKEKEVDLNDVS